MAKKSSHLRLVSARDTSLPSEVRVAVIASITEIEVVVPWYLRAFSVFISNPYMLTLQEFSEVHTDPLKIPTRTKQCNSFEELRQQLLFECQTSYNRGRLVVVDYTHKLEILALEFNN
jgi:hypothetical protein